MAGAVRTLSENYSAGVPHIFLITKSKNFQIHIEGRIRGPRRGSKQWWPNLWGAIWPVGPHPLFAINQSVVSGRNQRAQCDKHALGCVRIGHPWVGPRRLSPTMNCPLTIWTSGSRPRFGPEFGFENPQQFHCVDNIGISGRIFFANSRPLYGESIARFLCNLGVNNIFVVHILATAAGKTQFDLLVVLKWRKADSAIYCGAREYLFLQILAPTRVLQVKSSSAIEIEFCK